MDRWISKIDRSNFVAARQRKAQEGLEKAGKVEIREGHLGALERLQLPSKLVKRFHNQAKEGPGRLRKGWKGLRNVRKKETRLSHNQANIGLRKKERKKERPCKAYQTLSQPG